VLVDDSLVAVGSANLDALSLNKMEEAMLLADDAGLANELERQWVEDLKVSAERVNLGGARSSASH